MSMRVREYLEIEDPADVLGCLGERVTADEEIFGLLALYHLLRDSEMRMDRRILITGLGTFRGKQIVLAFYDHYEDLPMPLHFKTMSASDVSGAYISDEAIKKFGKKTILAEIIYEAWLADWEGNRRQAEECAKVRDRMRSYRTSISVRSRNTVPRGKTNLKPAVMEKLNPVMEGAESPVSEDPKAAIEAKHELEDKQIKEYRQCFGVRWEWTNLLQTLEELTQEDLNAFSPGNPMSLEWIQSELTKNSQLRGRIRPGSYPTNLSGKTLWIDTTGEIPSIVAEDVIDGTLEFPEMKLVEVMIRKPVFQVRGPRAKDGKLLFMTVAMYSLYPRRAKRLWKASEGVRERYNGEDEEIFT